MKELSPQARLLLERAGTGHGPAPGAAARVRAAVEAARVNPSAVVREVEAGLGAPASAGAGLGMVALGGTALLLAAIATVPTRTEPEMPAPVQARPSVFHQSRLEAPPRTEAPANAERQAVRRAPEKRVARGAVDRPAEAPIEPVLEPSPSEEPVAAPNVSPEVEPNPGSVDAVRAEAALLARARAALRDGDSAAALELARTHAERFPGGVLAEERWATEARALCGLGQSPAEPIAALRAHSPRSPHLAAIERACRR